MSPWWSFVSRICSMFVLEVRGSRRMQEQWGFTLHMSSLISGTGAGRWDLVAPKHVCKHYPVLPPDTHQWNTSIHIHLPLKGQFPPSPWDEQNKNHVLQCSSECLSDIVIGETDGLDGKRKKTKRQGWPCLIFRQRVLQQCPLLCRDLISSLWS